MLSEKQSEDEKIEINAFFETFSKVLVSGEHSKLLSHFHYPLVIMNHDEKHVFSNGETLKPWLVEYFKQFAKQDESSFRFKILKTLSLSDKVSFSKVQLGEIKTIDDKTHPNISFTLARDETSENLKIIVAVLDDA